MLYFGLTDSTADKAGREFRKAIRRAASAALAAEKLAGAFELSVTLCGDDEIRELNRTYRNKDRATDVLSFPASDGLDSVNPDNGALVLGDLVISVETARRQAKEYGNSDEREISFLTVHGMLHLLGFDHEISEDEERIMFGEQKKIIAGLYGEENDK